MAASLGQRHEDGCSPANLVRGVDSFDSVANQDPRPISRRLIDLELLARVDEARSARPSQRSGRPTPEPDDGRLKEEARDVQRERERERNELSKTSPAPGASI